MSVDAALSYFLLLGGAFGTAVVLLFGLRAVKLL
ncbi:cytochrome b6-f complex subunit PetL [Microcoleus sp. FACHB-672]|nr:cytochrome b6-f complex subunit PetL [Microcoleus sp. FACHB-672]MBD2039439.1 cytochrome b6-f complex subunit 6 [Microcoleus sp. FACHB-672]